MSDDGGEHLRAADLRQTKKKKKKISKIQKQQTEASSGREMEEGEEAPDKGEQSEKTEDEEEEEEEVKNVDENGMTTEMRRLLRAPRYFDEDFEEAAIRCFNCGGSGHMSYNCTNAKKQRPCFLCGGMGHQRTDCPNGLCFKCQQPGHTASKCTASQAQLAQARKRSTSACLRCGGEGHTSVGCSRSYSKQDLALVQCFVCFQLGHLCCGNRPSVATKESCYNCGESGHLAPKCPRPSRVSPGAAYAAAQEERPPMQCFRCKGPHMIRDCTVTDSQLRRVSSYGGTTGNLQVHVDTSLSSTRSVYPVYQQQRHNSSENLRAYPTQTNQYPPQGRSASPTPYSHQHQPTYPYHNRMHHSNSAPALVGGQYQWGDGRSHQQVQAQQFQTQQYGKRPPPHQNQYYPPPKQQRRHDDQQRGSQYGRQDHSANYLYRI